MEATKALLDESAKRTDNDDSTFDDLLNMHGPIRSMKRISFGFAFRQDCHCCNDLNGAKKGAAIWVASMPLRLRSFPHGEADGFQKGDHLIRAGALG